MIKLVNKISKLNLLLKLYLLAEIIINTFEEIKYIQKVGKTLLSTATSSANLAP